MRNLYQAAESNSGSASYTIDILVYGMFRAVYELLAFIVVRGDLVCEEVIERG